MVVLQRKHLKELMFAQSLLFLPFVFDFLQTMVRASAGKEGA